VLTYRFAMRVPALSRALADHAAAISGAVSCAAVLAWLGLTGFEFTDYDWEASGAFWALRSGDLEAFFSLAPVYGGSFVLRAPFAWLTALWGGGELAVYRAVSLPGLLAGVLLAVVVSGRMRSLGRSRLDRAVVLVALAASPIALRALEFGHSEELLGGALCVAAVLTAASRPLLAAVLIGLAVANKPWAFVAVPVIVAAAPDSRRVWTALVAGAVALVVVSPLLLFGGAFVQSTANAASTGDIFHPWQVWWFLGEGGPMQQLGPGDLLLRRAPEWLMPLTRPVVLALPIMLAAAWWWRRRAEPEIDRGAALLLLALVLHLRCLLDPWNIGYYALPALLALAAWEGLYGRDRPPVLTLAFVALNWLTFELLLAHASADMLSLFYLAWALPLAGWMVHRLLGSFIRPGVSKTSDNP